MKKILILYNTFGGGHVATSNALLEALKNENDYQTTRLIFLKK